MSLTLLFIMGIVSFFNLAIIYWKFKQPSRLFDAILDFAAFVLVLLYFSGSQAALFVGMVASMCMSLYLLISPPRLNRA